MNSFADEPAIQSITVGQPVPLTKGVGTKLEGDTWMLAWTKDGTMFSPANDSHGFGDVGNSNLSFSRITGDSPDHLVGETFNTMPDFGEANEKGLDGCTWKSSGCLALDGALYWCISRHAYGETSGDPHMRQTAHHGAILKSLDGGKTWTPSAKEAYDHPIFPGRRFVTSYFVNYGQEGHEVAADGSDKYIYATANNGFWDNGDDMILGRVLRSALPKLDGADWQYFTGGDGAVDANWNSDSTKAVPILAASGRWGETGAVYLPAQKCYLLIGWGYVAGGGKLPNACTTTQWHFYTSPHPWGPWKFIGSHEFHPQGFYCPEICPKFTSADGSVIWAATAGNWNDPAVYRLTFVPLTLR